MLMENQGREMFNNPYFSLKSPLVCCNTSCYYLLRYCKEYESYRLNDDDDDGHKIWDKMDKSISVKQKLPASLTLNLN